MTEVVVIIGVIALLMGILLPLLSRARTTSQSVGCLSNLRQIATAFHHYCSDNNGYYPPPSDPRVSDQSWESLLSKYLATQEAYHCQADGGMFEKIGSSYDWRDTSDPKTTLAGRRLADVRRPNLVLAFDALPDWHCADRINAVLADGSSQTVGFQECLQDLDRPIEP